MTTPTFLGPTTMRGVNNSIWESLDHGGHTDRVAFFCECGQEGVLPARVAHTRRVRAEPALARLGRRRGEPPMIEQPRPTLDFQCMTCGYGVARPQPPERCPMCACSRWRQHLQTHGATSMRLEMRLAGRSVQP